VLVAPFDVEDVLAPVYQLVAHSVPPVALVLDKHLVTRFLGAVYSDKQDVVAGLGAVHGERVLFPEDGSLEARTMAPDSTGVRVEAGLYGDRSASGGPGAGHRGLLEHGRLLPDHGSLDGLHSH